MAGVVRQQGGGVGLVNHQAVVVIQFFTGFDFAQGPDENTVACFIGFAIGLAGVVDPA